MVGLVLGESCMLCRKQGSVGEGLAGSTMMTCGLQRDSYCHGHIFPCGQPLPWFDSCAGKL